VGSADGSTPVETLRGLATLRRGMSLPSSTLPGWFVSSLGDARVSSPAALVEATEMSASMLPLLDEGTAKAAASASAKASSTLTDGAASDDSLRILMLHGWCQNAETFRQRLGPWKRKASKAGFHLTWCEAPHEVPDDAFGAKEGGKGWFFPELPPGSPPLASLTASRLRYIGLDDALVAVERAVAECGPFDAWVCFSQGAVLAHHLLSHGVAHRTGLESTASGSAPLPGQDNSSLIAPAEFDRRCQAVLPKCVVLACGFPSRSESPWPHDSPLPVPSFHVSSSSDATVAEKLQYELLERFDRSWSREHLRHGHGHAMVQRAGDISAVLDWIRAQSLRD
jgi:hypothetical protein